MNRNRKLNLASSKKVLLQNTFMLYLLTFSNYFLSLIVVPYETRVLGPAVYGALGAATAIMVYFQLVIDFGFLLSGTQEVARSRDDKKEVSRIFTATTLAKILLIVLSLVVLLLLCQLIPAWRSERKLYLLFFCSTAINSLIPDYLYRGLEKMSAITVRTVCIKAFFTLGIVLFLKTPEDVWMVPAINAAGCLVALVLTLLHLSRKLDIHFTAPDWAEAVRCLKRSSVFFYSRIATTAYSALNTVILDLLSASGATVGYYSSADRLITTGKNALSPISDSLYPYMVKNRDFKLIRKILLVFEPLIILFCIAVFIWAEPLCVLFFGAKFGPAAHVLRAMLPVGIFTLPSYILGFPTLTAMGLPEHANYSVVFGSAIHIVNLAILYFSGHMNMVTLGCAVSVAEALILGYRIVVVFRHRSAFQKEAHS